MVKDSHWDEFIVITNIENHFENVNLIQSMFVS